MTTLESTLKNLNITLGVQPSTDRTRFNTPHYTYCDKIRFYRGSPQKIGGNEAITFSGGATISGKPRSIYSCELQNRNTTVIGTHSFLYSLYEQSLTNISPLNTSTVAIAASISTDYATLGSDPIATTLGSGDLVITDTNAAKYQAQDRYTISGAATTNGINATLINVEHIVIAIGTNTVTVRTSGTATSTGSGGGASVVRATGLLTFAATAHGQADGDRTKITGAATTAGIVNTDINVEFIVRNSATDAFDVMTEGTATSHVTGGGGAGVEYQTQLAAGNEDQSFGIGWGVGLWGVGLWGVSPTSTTGVSYPRTWFMDRFGDTIIMTPGNQGGVYYWDGNISAAPVLVPNAPTDVNYAFVSDNILVTFGHDDIPNQIFASDQGDPTKWTASSLNQVYQDVIEGAGPLVSHCPVLGVNLIFTHNQTYKFSKVDINSGVWETVLLDNSIGIISPLARVSVNNVAYWMGRHNFYYWDGGNIAIIPSNTQEQCTALKYVFSNINTGQLSKIFAWYNAEFNEIWFHYPSASSNECDRIIRVNLEDMSWAIDTADRTAAEYPAAILGFPRLIDENGILYKHETGTDNNGAAMPWILRSNLQSSSKYITFVPAFVPDSIQTGNISLNFKGYKFPQSTSTIFNQTFTVTPTTERVTTQVAGRYWVYEWSGNSLGQDWNMGNWQEYVQTGAPN